MGKHKAILGLVILAFFWPAICGAAIMKSQNYSVDTTRVGDTQVVSSGTNSENYNVKPTGNSGGNQNTNTTTNTSANINSGLNGNINSNLNRNTNTVTNNNNQNVNTIQPSVTNQTNTSVKAETSVSWWRGWVGIGAASAVIILIVLLTIIFIRFRRNKH